MSQSSADNSIPLLTEVIAPPAAPESQASQALQWDDHQPQHNQHHQPNHQPDYQQHFQPEPIQAFQPQYQPTYDAAPLPVAISTPLPAVAPEPSAEQLRQIRQDIQENVMQTLLGQVDSVLHQHLQDHLAVILDNMADILKTRVRASLEQALAETVTQALAEEMAKFENAKY
ncbi:hypothetical protein [Herbaspirillum sp. NPDC101396]|uniref:hypothetical protein n=1 Tax=Herbaspirillum sp. NPDC101396 TaxID=3364005 RepID=UPI00383B3C7C